MIRRVTNHCTHRTLRYARIVTPGLAVFYYFYTTWNATCSGNVSARISYPTQTVSNMSMTTESSFLQGTQDISAFPSSRLIFTSLMRLSSSALTQFFCKCVCQRGYCCTYDVLAYLVKTCVTVYCNSVLCAVVCNFNHWAVLLPSALRSILPAVLPSSFGCPHNLRSSAWLHLRSARALRSCLPVP